MGEKIQVKTPGTGWATYAAEEGRAVAEAFRNMGIPVESRQVPAHKAQEESNGK